MGEARAQRPRRAREAMQQADGIAELVGGGDSLGTEGRARKQVGADAEFHGRLRRKPPARKGREPDVGEVAAAGAFRAAHLPQRGFEHHVEAAMREIVLPQRAGLKGQRCIAVAVALVDTPERGKLGGLRWRQTCGEQQGSGEGRAAQRRWGEPGPLRPLLGPMGILRSWVLHRRPLWGS